MSDVVGTAAELLRTHALASKVRPQFDDEQELLLRFLYTESSGLTLFDDWLRRVDLKNLEDGSYRLYGQIAEKLGRLAPDHPKLPYFRGNYKRAFYWNSLLFHRATHAIRELRKRNIPVLILKGAAHVRETARKVGARPMADVDFMISKEHVAVAFELLGNDAERALSSGAIAEITDFRHGHSFRDAHGFELDLHWQLAPELCLSPSDNAVFWLDSEPGEFFGNQVRYLCLTDYLFHICVHGVKYNPVAPIRWVGDALDVLNNRGDAAVSWQQLIARARQLGAALPLLLALETLRRDYAAPVPAEAIDALGRAPVTSPQLYSYVLHAMPWKTRIQSWEEVSVMVDHWLSLKRRTSPGHPALLQLVSSAKSPHHLRQATRWCEARDCNTLIRLALSAEEQREVVRAINHERPDLLTATRTHFTRLAPELARTIPQLAPFSDHVFLHAVVPAHSGEKRRVAIYLASTPELPSDTMTIVTWSVWSLLHPSSLGMIRTASGGSFPL